MNYENNNLQNKLSKLTQTLDHSVPDPDAPSAANKLAAEELARISKKLYDLLPDPSLSPLERLERLRRVVDHVEPDMSQLKSAISKVETLNERLNLFVNDKEMTAIQKIDQLVEKVNKCFENKTCRFGAKVEMLGDPRAGIAPVSID
jgi:hypothetical protein